MKEFPSYEFPIGLELKGDSREILEGEREAEARALHCGCSADSAPRRKLELGQVCEFSLVTSLCMASAPPRSGATRTDTSSKLSSWGPRSCLWGSSLLVVFAS